MRIAFASCMFNRIVERQPVWGWIGARNPDHLVLLGDSFYLDLQIGGRHPQDMLPMEFAEHLQTLYHELIEQPDFAALVRALPAGHVHAIWDDHDFLWNDACGAEVRSTHRYDDHLRLTTAYMEQFRRSLAGRLESFQPPAPSAATPPLGTPTVKLGDDVHLHLSDGRTFRTRTHLIAESKRTLFGADQRLAFTQRITGAPDAIHLWASGSTIAGYQRYERDLAWLKGLAAQRRMLMLSGDIHRNAFDTFQTGGFPLHEATSSGAAIKDAVVFGHKRQNFGLLEIDAENVTLEFHKDNAVEARHVIERGGWKTT